MFRKILGPFPLLCGLKNTELSFFRGGSQNDVCLSDKAFFEIMTETIDFDSNKNKPRRLNNKQVRELLSTKAKLTKEQQLLKSVLKKASVFKVISDKSFQNVQEMYEFRRKYKKYIRIKRFVPLTLIAPFRVTELSKMAYATALGSKSIYLTLPGLIGYSLPAFYFFHMSSFYVPDKLKLVCQVCKYILSAPFWVMGSITDGIMVNPEEIYFGEEVPIDFV